MGKTKNIPWPGVIRSNYFTKEQKETFEKLCGRFRVSGPLNESILKRMRKGLDVMRQEGVRGLDEETIDKLQDVMKSSSSFAAYLDKHFRKSYDKILAYYKGQLEKPKAELMRHLQKGTFDYPKDNIKEEVESLSKLSVFWLKDFKNILSDQNRQKFAQTLMAESMGNSADVMLAIVKFNPLNESANWSFLDRSSEAIATTEPFRTISKIGELGKPGNSTLNEFAKLSARIGAPKSVQYKGLGSIVGKLAEHRETSIEPEAIMKADPILRFLPVAPALIKSFEMIALTATVLEVMSDLKDEK